MSKGLSEETRKKISETLKRKGLKPPTTHRIGSLNPFFGKKHTPETIELIKAKRRLQLSSGMKGRHHSEESKRRMSLSKWKGGLTRRQRLELKAGCKTASNCETCQVSGAQLKKGLCYDHDHNTGTFRGWLCSNCNSVLGLVKESQMVLQSLINYLRKNQK